MQSPQLADIFHIYGECTQENDTDLQKTAEFPFNSNTPAQVHQNSSITTYCRRKEKSFLSNVKNNSHHFEFLKEQVNPHQGIILFKTNPLVDQAKLLVDTEKGKIALKPVRIRRLSSSKKKLIPPIRPPSIPRSNDSRERGNLKKKSISITRRTWTSHKSKSISDKLDVLIKPATPQSIKRIGRRMCSTSRNSDKEIDWLSRPTAPTDTPIKNKLFQALQANSHFSRNSNKKPVSRDGISWLDNDELISPLLKNKGFSKISGQNFNFGSSIPSAKVSTSYPPSNPINMLRELFAGMPAQRKASSKGRGLEKSQMKILKLIFSSKLPKDSN